MSLIIPEKQATARLFEFQNTKDECTMKRLLMVLTAIVLSTSCWSFTGKIVNNNGKPIAKAKVAAYMFWTTDRTFHTDAKGEFVYLTMAVADFTHVVKFKITDKNGKPVQNATVTIPWDHDVPTLLSTNERGVFNCPVPNDSKGLMRILDKTGHPVPGAKAVMTSLRPNWKDEYVMNDKGEFQYRNIQTNRQTEKELLFIVAPDGYTYASSYYHVGQKEPLVMNVWPERLTKARVVDESGRPVQGATVVIDNVRAKIGTSKEFNISPHPDSTAKMKTSKDGSFLLRHLPGKEFEKSTAITMTFDAPERSRIERREYQLTDLRESGKIVLPRACAVQGFVCLPVGAKAMPENLMLEMNLQEEGSPAYESDHWTGIGKDGSFRFEKLSPGTATIILGSMHKSSLGWVLSAVQNLQIGSGEVKNVNLTATIGAVISGCVLDKDTGKPVSGVLMVEHTGSPNGESWYIDNEGKYSIRVPAGKVNIYVSFVFTKNTRVDYDPKDRPVISLEVTDGEDKPGQNMSISLPVK